ncbi:hypothetical protein UT300012_32740 [Paraclostridium bifermentans]
MSWNPVLNKVIEVKREWEKICCHEFGSPINTFEEMLEIVNIKEYNELFDCLQLNQFNEFLLIRYGLAEMQKGMWEDENSIYRECRSVVIDLKNECLVITPFKKFFNLDEVKENKLDNVLKKINEANIVEIVDKLDGSMQCARWYNDNVFMSGSMAININNSWRLQDGMSMLTKNHKTMLKENPEYTFVFEYISMKDAHVVLYNKEQEGLYLIGIRDVNTGIQLNYRDIKEFSKRYNVHMAKIENIKIDEVLKNMKIFKSNEKEGWILNIDGHLIKIKCDDYVHLHRLLDKFSSVNVIIENVAEGRIDDMLSKVPESYIHRITQISDKIINWRDETLKNIDKYYGLAPKTNTKEFMIWVDNEVPCEIKGYVKLKYKGIGFNVLKRKVEGYKKLKDLGICEDYSALFSSLED